MGVVYPDKMIAGNIKIKTPSIACCWVLNIEDIKSPIATIEIKNSTKEKKNSAIEPQKGRLKKIFDRKRMIIELIIPKNRGTIIFPRIISLVFKGKINNSSNVPISFSLASESEDNKITAVIGKIPIKEATIKR